MRIGFISESNNWHTESLLRAAREHECHTFHYSDLGTCFDKAKPTEFSVRDLPIPLADFDALLIRPMPSASLTQIVYRMDMLDQLERQFGTVVINPAKTIECCVDKYLSLERMRKSGLPVPKTAVSQSSDHAMQQFHQLGRDVVCKPIFGSGGHGIRRLRDSKEAREHFCHLEHERQVIYQQEFVEHGESDFRFLVIGQTVLGMKRTHKGQWLTNVQQGAVAEPHLVTLDQQNLACRAAAAVQAELAGVDVVINSEGHPLIVEVNACPAWKALSNVVSQDVSRLVIAQVESRVKHRFKH